MSFLLQGKTRVIVWLDKHWPKLMIWLEIARHSRHFEPEYWLVPKLCGRDEMALDIGGNEGQYAYFMARHSREVHVFEPNPKCFDHLMKLRLRNVVLHPEALSDHHGVSLLRFNPDNTGIGTIEQNNRLDWHADIGPVVETEVRMLRLDDLDLRGVRFIKIDVEGHEAAVLRGGLDLLRRETPILLVECERRLNPASFEELQQLLVPLGYGCFRLAACGLVPAIAAEVNELQHDPNSKNYVNNFLFFPPRWNALRHNLEMGDLSGPEAVLKSS